MPIFFALLTILYVALMAALFFGWNRIREYRLKHSPPDVSFSVIIPFRNEAENLPFLLQSLIRLKYPSELFEVIFINDASEDNSLEICSRFLENHQNIDLKLVENERKTSAPKKDAITTAIKLAKYDYILTTDADCILPTLLLQAFNEKIVETQADLVAGPVRFPDSPQDNPEKAFNYFQAFQELDFMSLQVAGAGGFGLGKAFMCNGANLCYRKSAFFNVHGFTGNEAISSGDDVFLLQKFRKENLIIEFLKCKEAIVLTKPQPVLKDLISQRIRWAAKTPAYTSWLAKLIGLSVLLINFSLVAGAFLALFQLIFFEPVLIAFLFKFMVDLGLIYKAAVLFKRKAILRHYFWSSLFYPFFSTWVALASLNGKYSWKGRISK